MLRIKLSEEVISEIKDICLELNDFGCYIEILFDINKCNFIRIMNKITHKSFIYITEIKEVIDRIRDYVSQFGISIRVNGAYGGEYKDLNFGLIYDSIYLDFVNNSFRKSIKINDFKSYKG
jgi:hypothetical protein